MNGRGSHQTRQSGFSLIEILVGLVLGLFIVGAAMGLLLAQLREQHQRSLEARLQQELRAGLVLMEQELRRAGHWGDAARGVWDLDVNATPLNNPYAAVDPASASSNAVGYSYSRDSTENQQVDTNERFGFRIHPSTRALELRTVGAALAPTEADTWQALTDPLAVRITELNITSDVATLDLGERCSLPCPTGSASCPPRLQLRRLTLTLTAQSAVDTSLQRRMSRVIHLPNDVQQGRCAGV